jgi:hypothetical protein
LWPTPLTYIHTYIHTYISLSKLYITFDEFVKFGLIFSGQWSLNDIFLKVVLFVSKVIHPIDW